LELAKKLSVDPMKTVWWNA